MLNKKEKTTLISNLPQGWRADAANEFKKSQSYVEKVAYGTIENLEVFEYLIAKAEQYQQQLQLQKAELKQRLHALGKTSVA